MSRCPDVCIPHRTEQTPQIYGQKDELLSMIVSQISPKDVTMLQM